MKVEGPNLWCIDMVGSVINDIDFACCNGNVCHKIGSECFIPFFNFCYTPCVFLYASIHVYVYILEPYGRKGSCGFIQEINT
jgi:hypothetical protein